MVDERQHRRIEERRLEVAAGEHGAVGVETVFAAPHAQRELEGRDERARGNRPRRARPPPRRRDARASSQPPLRAGAEGEIGEVGQAGDRQHADRHRIAEIGIVQHVAADLRVEQDRRDVERGAGQRIGGRDRAEGVGEQQRAPRRARSATGSAARSSRQYCQELAPSVSAASAHSRFRPSIAGVTTSDHQRDLEIEIGDGEAPEGQDVEAVRIEVEAEISQQHGDEAEAARASP